MLERHPNYRAWIALGAVCFFWGTTYLAIRMALGSQRSGIVTLILFSGFKLAAAGCIIGLVGAFFASRLLKTFVFGVSTFDPVVLVLAAVVVLMLAVAASLLPARRAAAINPMQALRAE